MTYDEGNSNAKTILLADDEASILDACQIALEACNNKVVIASNGRDCIESFRRESELVTQNGQSAFDVVILDYRMPLKNGFEVAKEILSEFPEQRIIISSATPGDSLLKLFKLLNKRVEILQKPFDLDKLVNLVEYGDLARPHGTHKGVGSI